MNVTPEDRLLFTGDSITDGSRDRADPDHPGSGFVALLAATLQTQPTSPGLRIWNRGIGGNRLGDLVERMEADLAALQPTVVTILIGINDTWRRYGTRDPQEATDAATFRESYRRLLNPIREKSEAKIILMEPFLLHVPEDRFAWREDLNPKIDVVREMAMEFGTSLVPLDGLFARAATRAPARYWIPDGVHPGAPGCALIAEAWLDAFSVGR